MTARSHRFFASSALVVALVSAAAAPALADWPQYHGGPARIGVNTGAPIPAYRLDHLRVLWKRRTGRSAEGVNSSAAVVDGVVYVGSDDGRLYAMSATTGRVLWSKPTGGIIRSSPAVGGGAAFVGSDDGYVYAFGARTGALRWKRNLRGPVSAPPLFVGGVVYLGTRHRGDFFALDASTGRILWTRHIWSVWDAAAYANGAVFVASDQRKLFAFDAGSGTRRWASRLFDRGRGAPAVAGGTVYVGDDSGRVSAFNAGTGRRLWNTRAAPADTGPVVRSTPAVVNGRVFVTSGETSPMRGHAVAFDGDDGRVLWRRKLADYSTSSPAFTNGLLFLGSFDHRLYAIDAGTGRTRWTSGWTFEGGFFDRGIKASPAISGGRVYIGVRDGAVYAIGLPR